MDRKNLFTRLLILLLTLMFFGGVILGIVNLLSSEGQEPPEETAQQSANPLPGEPQEILAYISRLSERASHENAGLKKCYEISIDDGFEVKNDQALAGALGYVKEELVNSLAEKYEDEEFAFGQNFQAALLGLDFPPQSVLDFESQESGKNYELSLSFLTDRNNSLLEGLEEGFDTEKSKSVLMHLFKAYGDIAHVGKIEITAENLKLDCQIDRLKDEIDSLVYTKEFSVKAELDFKGELENLGVKAIGFTLKEKIIFEFIHIGLRLEPEKLSLKKGDVKVIKAYVSAPQGIKVSWRSSNEAVVGVDADGYVKAKERAASPIKIEAEFSCFGRSYKDTCELYVTLPVKKVSLSPKRLEINVGEEKQLSAFVKPKDATIQGVLWFSENDKIASVDQNGKVRGVGSGETKVYVLSKDGYYRLSCKVTVKP
ncbi:MAG: hypothetical protein GX345_02875 [Clostridiales bacterium]|nr:hypothetical protein [Clostridiales bacterium]